MAEPLASGMRDDVSIWPILSELAACLCAEISVNGESPCFCGVVAGNIVPTEGVDGCETCGAGYVRLVDAYPSTQLFPQADQSPTCRSVLAFNVVVGVVRCAPTGDGDYPPSQDELTEFARQVFADMAAIRRAIRCCLTDDKFEDITYVLGSYTPLPDEGGIGGGEWQLVIQELI